MIFAVLFVLAFRWAGEALVDALTRELTWDRASAASDPDEWLGQQVQWFFDLRAASAQLAIWIGPMARDPRLSMVTPASAQWRSRVYTRVEAPGVPSVGRSTVLTRTPGRSSTSMM